MCGTDTLAIDVSSTTMKFESAMIAPAAIARRVVKICA
jgi:hypothetical protein